MRIKMRVNDRMARVAMVLLALTWTAVASAADAKATNAKPTSASATKPPPPLAPVPSLAQLAWQEDELTVFLHFGMNTFTKSSIGKGNEDPKLFNPTNLDCRQWVRVAKQCGFKGMLLVAKHHDGFCNWPTTTTKHSVASSTWRDGKGDVVRELADACREGGLKLGIYCSPWDKSQPDMYKNDKPAYAKYYRQQLTELLSNYGPIYEMWFDGNQADVADWPNVVSLVRKLQPNAIIKQGPYVSPISEDVRWVGNELACAPLANWSVLAPGDNSNRAKSTQPIWFPRECDTPMIGNWFWNDALPHELATLLNFYYTSVGRNSIFLVNIAPNREGLFSKETVERMIEFHDALEQIFRTDFAAGKKATASNVRGNDPGYGADKALDGRKDTYWTTDDGVTNAWLEVDLGGEKEFNVIRMEEMISLGQRVAEYQVEVWNAADKTWKPVSKGATIGYRKLDRIPKVTASKVRLTLLQSRACPLIKSFGVHLDTVSPPEHFEPAVANAEVKGFKRMPPQPKKPATTASAP